jgi:hypothetical protein
MRIFHYVKVSIKTNSQTFRVIAYFKLKNKDYYGNDTLVRNYKSPFSFFLRPSFS